MSFVRTVLSDVPPAPSGGAPALSFPPTVFSAQLRAAGMTANALHRLFVTTPAATFSFAAVSP